MFEKIAKSIARSTADIIGRGVLVTDERGVIIGCDNSYRIGRSHAPSLEVIEKDRASATSAEDAAKMKDVYPGYTLPIHFSGRVVGSVSITGSPSEVERYGLLVQKQAEMMLREQALLESTLMRERALADLIENITFFDGKGVSQDVIVQQGRDLGFDLSRCRVALCIELRRGKKTAERSLQSFMREVRGAFSNPANVISMGADHSASVLLACTGGAEGSEDRAKTAALCLVESAADRKVEIDAAVGFAAEGLAELSASIRAARAAMRIGRSLGKSGVLLFRDFIGEALLDFIPRDRRNEFAAGTLKGLEGRDDFEELKNTFLAWCDSPFSPSKAAERLSMHRNSLQYRLKKIRSLTGKDPWSFKDAFQLWAAFIITNLR